MGWVLFAASFCLPVVGFVFHPPGGMHPRYGYEIVGGGPAYHHHLGFSYWAWAPALS